MSSPSTGQSAGVAFLICSYMHARLSKETIPAPLPAHPGCREFYVWCMLRTHGHERQPAGLPSSGAVRFDEPAASTGISYKPRAFKWLRGGGRHEYDETRAGLLHFFFFFFVRHTPRSISSLSYFENFEILGGGISIEFPRSGRLGSSLAGLAR